VDVFIRSYVPSRPIREISVEDAFDCPLIELGLLDEVERGVYRFVRGYKPSLPTEILVASILEYWQASLPEQKSLSFDRLQFWPGSPGAVFKLSEDALAERLEHLPRWSGLHYDETAGVRLLFRTGDLAEPDETRMTLLEGYYRRSRAEVLKQLPPRTDTRVPVAITDAQRAGL